MDLDRQRIEQDYNKLLKELVDPEIVSDWEKFENLTKTKKKK